MCVVGVCEWVGVARACPGSDLGTDQRAAIGHERVVVVVFMQFLFRSVGFLGGTLLVGLAWERCTRQHRLYSLAAAGLAAQLAVRATVDR